MKQLLLETRAKNAESNQGGEFTEFGTNAGGTVGRAREGIMVNKGVLLGWGACLILAAPEFSAAQEQGVLPRPGILQNKTAPAAESQPPAQSDLAANPPAWLAYPYIANANENVPPNAGPVVNAHGVPAAHPGLYRLWKFVTFCQPPRPRECQGCCCAPSSRCRAPLYTYFVDRYPTYQFNRPVSPVVPISAQEGGFGELK